MTAAPYYADDTVTVHHGDCLDILATLPDASVDAVVTDPPYGLEFMGKEWDAPWKAEGTVLHDPSEVGGFQDGSGGNPFSRSRVRFDIGAGFQAWCELWATECLRVLKPGGHLLAFGGTRTSHRLACAIEDAGFEIRDSIAWLYGSGFPKSLDVSKAIDKAAGVEGDVIGHRPAPGGDWTAEGRARGGVGGYPIPITAPATDAARTWQGWGTALKPAHEPIVVARKPLSGTVAANVLEHGTGAINVGACRVASADPIAAHHGTKGGDVAFTRGGSGGYQSGDAGAILNHAGRWPANVVLDESQAHALDQQSGDVGANGGSGTFVQHAWMRGPSEQAIERDNEGGASRFFAVFQRDAQYHPCGGCENVIPVQYEWCGGCRPGDDPYADCFMYTAKADAAERVRIDGTAHPTVKPLALMRWLVRLVCPPGGTVLEPFAGSGTTVEACILEGFRCIAIEREADYLPLITQRIHRRRDPVAAVLATAEDGGLFDLLGGEE